MIRRYNKRLIWDIWLSMLAVVMFCVMIVAFMTSI